MEKFEIALEKMEKELKKQKRNFRILESVFIVTIAIFGFYAYNVNFQVEQSRDRTNIAMKEIDEQKKTMENNRDFFNKMYAPAVVKAFSKIQDSTGIKFDDININDQGKNLGYLQ